MDRAALEQLDREALIEKARELGAHKPEVLTRVELADEVLRLGTADPGERRRARGFFGLARDLVASVVEQGLNLPDAAALIRGDISFQPRKALQRPVATVTLAEIYAAQGHHQRSLDILDEVLQNEPDHSVARQLRDRLGREMERRVAKAGFEAANRPDVSPRPIELSEPPSSPGGKNGGGGRGPDDDAAIALRSAPGVALIYWEMSPRTAERLEAAADARAVVRVLEVRPDPAGAQVLDHEVSADAVEGVARVEGIEEESVLRAALGIRHGSSFQPVAVAAEVRRLGDAGLEVAWAPRAGLDLRGVCERAAKSFG